jgi:hypothetical protein
MDQINKFKCDATVQNLPRSRSFSFSRDSSKLVSSMDNADGPPVGKKHAIIYHQNTATIVIHTDLVTDLINPPNHLS